MKPGARGGCGGGGGVDDIFRASVFVSHAPAHSPNFFRASEGFIRKHTTDGVRCGVRRNVLACCWAKVKDAHPRTDRQSFRNGRARSDECVRHDASHRCARFGCDSRRRDGACDCLHCVLASGLAQTVTEFCAASRNGRWQWKERGGFAERRRTFF